jgi:hypothetical protein
VFNRNIRTYLVLLKCHSFYVSRFPTIFKPEKVCLTKKNWHALVEELSCAKGKGNGETGMSDSNMNTYRIVS